MASNITLTQREHTALVRKSKTGWAKYYSLLEETQEEMIALYSKLIEVQNKLQTGIPTHIKDELREMGEALHKRYECAICLDLPEVKDVELTNCGHRFCKSCLVEAKKHSSLCPACRQKMYS